MLLINGNLSTHYFSKALEGLKDVLVSPSLPEALHKDPSVEVHSLPCILLIRKSPAHFPFDFWVSDLQSELPRYKLDLKN